MSAPRTKGWTRVGNGLPEDGRKVEVWFDVYASPHSMGISDSWNEPDCWRADGKWVHQFRGEVLELEARYITHWRPTPKRAREPK